MIVFRSHVFADLKALYGLQIHSLYVYVSVSVQILFREVVSLCAEHFSLSLWNK